MKLLSRKPDFVISDEGVDLVEKVMLGGIEQSILIQAQNRNNPVLLFLHGGPSTPIPGIACRGKDYTIATNTKELVNHFVLVFWDQRGTGKSYHPDIPEESLTIKQFVSDANELTDMLRTRFKKEKIFLAGHSWGSIIGLRLASEQTEKFYSYVGLSQIISWSENDQLALNWAKEQARKKGNKKALKELESVGEAPFLDSYEQWSVLRKWLIRFNSMIYSGEDVKHPGMLKSTKELFQSKDYTLKDVYNTFYKGFKLVYNPRMILINDLAQFNFKESVRKMDLPVTFLHGEKDVHVNKKPVLEFFEKLESSYSKELHLLPKSSHFFHPDDTKKIEGFLINQIKHQSNIE
ncbi:alpha/beta fold hydrolase [Bacillus sp. CGMCC 1.16607]|uniref:alpha/beta fold hydrolase n=1 Tax=Bacillus sp. CGMCC 1.16607 TaxID=3351842 RepID=UPI00362B6E0F